MNKGMVMAAFFCVVLLISSVTAVPAAAAVFGSDAEYPDTLTADLVGRTVDLGYLSESFAFGAGDVLGIDIQIGVVGRGPRGDGCAIETIRDGIFTITQGEQGSRVSRSGLDEQGIGLVEALQSVGFAFDGAITDPYETTVSFGAVPPAVDPAVLAASGLRRSTDTSALVGSGRITIYTFTNTTTGRLFELTVTQPTDEHGNAVGKAVVSTPSSQLGGKTARSTTNEPYRDAGIAVVVVGGTGAVAGVATTIGLFGGAATVTELTPLLGGTAAVCCGLSATGVGVVVGVAVAVGVGIIVAYWLFTHHGDGDSLASSFQVVTGPPSYPIRVHDGVVTMDDGSVVFLDRITPALRGHTDWIQVTRGAAITRGEPDGELWRLTDSKGGGREWTQYPSDRRYRAIDQTGSWVAAVSMDDTGKTYLEIPQWDGQPTPDTHIGKDVATLNAGKNPHHHHWLRDQPIDPPVTGWNAFISGDDYGLALAEDGRVFCVGTSKDNLGDLHGRYTKVVTGIHKGRLENDRYAIGIRASDGGLDFAGDDPNHINDDIKKAHLVHVRDIAAGSDRAIAITRYHGLKVLGDHKKWSGDAPTETAKGHYGGIGVSTDDTGHSQFVAITEPMPTFDVDYELQESTMYWPVLIFSDTDKAVLLNDIATVFPWDNDTKAQISANLHKIWQKYPVTATSDQYHADRAKLERDGRYPPAVAFDDAKISPSVPRPIVLTPEESATITTAIQTRLGIITGHLTPSDSRSKRWGGNDRGRISSGKDKRGAFFGHTDIIYRACTADGYSETEAIDVASHAMEPDTDFRANIPGILRDWFPDASKKFDQGLHAHAHYYNPDVAGGIPPAAGGATLFANVYAQAARRTYSSDRTKSNTYLAHASHYLTDISNPMHTGGESWQISSQLREDQARNITSVHNLYEQVIADYWNATPEEDPNKPEPVDKFTFSQAFDGLIAPVPWPGSVGALAEGMGRFSHQRLTDKFNHAVKTGADATNTAMGNAEAKTQAKISIYRDPDVRKVTTECLREALARSITLVSYTQGRIR